MRKEWVELSRQEKKVAAQKTLKMLEKKKKFKAWLKKYLILTNLL